MRGAFPKGSLEQMLIEHTFMTSTEVEHLIPKIRKHPSVAKLREALEDIASDREIAGDYIRRKAKEALKWAP